MEQQFFSISIRGESHIRNNKPMQDFSLAYKHENYCVGIVCDGHGADKHFRSEKGSEFAAKITYEKFNEFVKLYPDWKSLEKVEKTAIDRLKLSILSEWHNKIEIYTKNNPFTEDDLKKASKSFLEKKNYNIAQPYGTTLLAVLVTEEYYLALMIGDGAMIKILPDFSANIVQFPGKKVYDDEPHAATDSMCESNAFQNLFHILSPIQEQEKGIAFAMCSDGMSEAFETDQILIKKINNYLNYFAEEGMEKSLSAIEQQLNQLSRVSPMKDDISLAFATNHIELFDKRVTAQDDKTLLHNEEGRSSVETANDSIKVVDESHNEVGEKSQEIETKEGDIHDE